MNCFQFIRSNNEYYLTDINPRFGGGSIVSWYASDSLKYNLQKLLNCESNYKIKYKDVKNIRLERYYLDEIIEVN